MASETVAPERTVPAVTVERRNSEGEVIDTVELDAAIFGVVPNIPLMHQVVTAQLAARRSGTHSTKTRSEVSGGGAKPYRQKGTGRARQGSIRAPHYAGGGVALGPKPRSYAQRTPRKMVRLALCSALSDRLNEGKLRLVDAWPFAVPKTKEAVKVLDALEVEGRILVVLSSDDAVAERSFGNLRNVHLVEAAQLSAYEVLANDWIVFTTATVPGGVTVVEVPAAKPKRKPRAPRGAAADVAPLAAETDTVEAAAESEAAEVAADESTTEESATEAVVAAEASSPSTLEAQGDEDKAEEEDT